MFNNRYRPGAKKEINYREEEKKILDSVMAPDNYDKRIRPSGLNSTGESVSGGKFIRGNSNWPNIYLMTCLLPDVV